MEDDTSVRVAVRIRPQIPRELIDMCRVCTSVSTNEPQVWLGNDKTFTFDYVFDIPSVQQQVYETCVQQLIEGCFEGYNATVLAYGQTGSGKTYTMGTGFDVSIGDVDELGIIPRAVEHLFEGIEERRQRAYDNNEPLPDFKIHCQFMELYNEEIIDLFDTARDSFSKGKRSSIRIHEDAAGGIYTVGVTTRVVTSKAETLQCLKIGALSRTTASTQMNVASSRSHAIFTLYIKQQRVAKIKDPDMELDTTDALNEFESLTAKFHFVDLAGSERLKRTGATGDRAKEGISINCGLLALGNVISALGDITKRGSHVPYRDSKLTRLLQDSLGGNSRTVMIACISPSDRDFMETLNTLKYANRARNIKNKVVANQDKTSKQLSALRMEIQQLQLELMEYRQGKRVVVDGEESINDMYHENTMLQTENNNLRVRIKAMQETIETQTVKNTELLASKAAGEWIASGGENSDMSKMIEGYIKEVEELRIKLLESEHMCQTMRKSVSRTQTRLSMSPLHNQAVAFSGQYDIGCDVETSSVNELLEEAKKDVERLRDAERRVKRVSGGDKLDICNESDEEEDGEQKDGMEELEDSDELNEENNNDDDDEEDSSESDMEVVDEQYRSDLAELSSEISIKQKLIDELEKSQKRLQTMRHAYEEKLVQLQNKIRATQEERDKVLSNLGNIEHHSQEKTQKVRGEYEKKLNDLTSELKKIQSAKKEHARLLKNQTMYEKQMKTLRTELNDMKKAKVRLMTKIKDEVNKHKESEQRRNREIAQLKKESRVRENQIRTLQAEKKLKETVLKRKQEEVSALRRMAKPMSDKVAGRIPGARARYALQSLNRKPQFSPKVAKSKWQHLEKDITKMVLNKKAIATWEKEMEKFLKERDILTRKLEKCVKKRDVAKSDGRDRLTIQDLEDQIEAFRDNINYIQENISECQTNIMQTEGSKDGQENVDVNTLVNDLGVEEARYMLEKMLAMTISQSLLAAQREANLKEMEGKMTQAEQSCTLHQELLEHMLQQQDMDMYNPYLNGDLSGDSSASTRSVSPIDSMPMQTQVASFGSSSSTESLKTSSKIKARRRTAANPLELLYGGSSESSGALSTQTFLDIQEENVNTQTEKENGESPLYSTTLSVSCNTSTQSRPTSARMSPQSQRRTSSFPTSSFLSNTLQHSNNDNVTDPTPPASPMQSRKGLAKTEENVFSRLASVESSQPNSGVIKTFAGKVSGRTQAMLTCTHVAIGHNKAVLSVVATDDLLFTASKDRTVKVWDLHRGEEILSLSGHINNVVAVRYCERTKQVFTASAAYIKVWDLRGSGAKCISTLHSSGLTSNGPLTAATPARTLKLPHGEFQINDFELDRFGTALYSAANNFVRIWDLRKYQTIGKLSGGHQAAIMCLAVDDKAGTNNLIVTGSKDHYIKMFEVPAMTGGCYPAKKNLEPPHYDGIQSLALVGSYLFSGSRDMCIKKWNLQSGSLEQSLNQAHKDWVCGLCIHPESRSILSCCRGGSVRQWSVSSCRLLGEVKAHEKSIHAITKNSSCIFTASDDNTVRIWKMRSTREEGMTNVGGSR